MTIMGNVFNLKNTVKIIDLSVPVSPHFFELDPVFRETINHKEGADLLGNKKITHHDFPDEKGLSLMRYTLNTHTGTHMDSPYHYGDQDIDGNPAKTISDIPLEWCFSRGVVVDVTSGKPDEIVTKKEIIESLSENQQAIYPNNIVLIHTAKQQNIGTPEYFTHYRGISREVIEFLIDKGIHIIGIDSFSFDPPFQGMIEQYLNTNDKRYLWPAHMLGREKPYCQLERLANLDRLKKYKEFTICCFPIHLLEADASWCRVVAIINDDPQMLKKEVYYANYATQH